jgi:hypothetical protein
MLDKQLEEASSPGPLGSLYRCPETVTAEGKDAWFWWNQKENAGGKGLEWNITWTLNYPTWSYHTSRLPLWDNICYNFNWVFSPFSWKTGAHEMRPMSCTQRCITKCSVVLGMSLKLCWSLSTFQMSVLMSYGTWTYPCLFSLLKSSFSGLLCHCFVENHHFRLYGILLSCTEWEQSLSLRFSLLVGGNWILL